MHVHIMLLFLMWLRFASIMWVWRLGVLRRGKEGSGKVLGFGMVLWVFGLPWLRA